jgi:hypothetical protein
VQENILLLLLGRLLQLDRTHLFTGLPLRHSGGITPHFQLYSACVKPRAFQSHRRRDAEASFSDGGVAIATLTAETEFMRSSRGSGTARILRKPS